MSLIDFKEKDNLKLPNKKILYFNSQFCAQCFGLKSKLENISDKLQIPVYSINVNDNKNISEKYNVQSLPYVLFVNGDKIFDYIIGNASEDIIENKFKSFQEI